MKSLSELIAQAEHFTPKSRYEVELSAVEKRMVAMMADGNSDKTIAREVGKAPETVRSQILVARRKMGAKNRPHLVKLWLQKTP